MQSFLQYVVIGLGLGGIYALFAQGAVLIYRGSGLVNFAHGAIGTLAAYVCFIEMNTKQKQGLWLSAIVGIAVGSLSALLFQVLVLRRLRTAAALVRVISTTALLGLLRAVVEKRYGAANKPVKPFLPQRVFTIEGVKVQQEVIYLVAISVIVTVVLWAWTKYTRVGLAIAASAQNERAVQTLGWSPDRLAALTWALGGALASLAAVLVAPRTGLSTTTNTLVVTVAGLGAALLGGFHSFPMTFVGGLIIGLSEALATGYKGDVQDLFNQKQITGLNRAPAFLIIMFFLVIRGKGLPLRSHVAERLPKLGTGILNFRGMAAGSAVFLGLLWLLMGKSWAQAAHVSLVAGIMVLSIVVVTGFAGQISLGQWAIAGVGALTTGRLVQKGMPTALAMLFGIVMAVIVGVLFALPALRTRGVNLAVVTLSLGFAMSEVLFANQQYLGSMLDSGTKIGRIKLFGLEVDASRHGKRWALVCFVFFLLCSLMVANLRRSSTGRRLIAVRTNERAAASLGISVFGAKLFAFGVASGLAGLAGILSALRFTSITYSNFNLFESISSVGHAVVGGLGFVIAGVFGAPNAVGGLGTRVTEDWLHLKDKWDLIIGSLIMMLILIAQPDGVAAKVAGHGRHLWETLRLAGRAPQPSAVGDAVPDAVAPKVLTISGLTVRFGGVVAVNEASFEVRPGEVVGLIGPNGAGKTTVIDAVTGFVRPSAGNLTLDGQEIGSMNATARSRLGLRRSFQSLELFEDATVEDNIRAGADVDSKLSWLRDLVRPRRAPLTAASVAAIREFGLVEDLAKLPTELPYGRRRLVGIARAVASAPSVLMLDEPAAGLDENESRELAKLVRKLADDWKMAVLLVEHDVNMVMSTCDRVVVIEFGRVIASGDPATVRADPKVRAAYLGEEQHDGEEVPV